MATTTPEAQLDSTLTALVMSTPGVTQLYLSIRSVPGAARAHRVLADSGVPVPAAQVVVDHAAGTVTASVGIDRSASPEEIGGAVCSRILEHLALAGLTLNVKVSISYVSD